MRRKVSTIQDLHSLKCKFFLDIGVLFLLFLKCASWLKSRNTGINKGKEVSLVRNFRAFHCKPLKKVQNTRSHPQTYVTTSCKGLRFHWRHLEVLWWSPVPVSLWKIGIWPRGSRCTGSRTLGSERKNYRETNPAFPHQHTYQLPVLERPGTSILSSPPPSGIRGRTNQSLVGKIQQPHVRKSHNTTELFIPL